MKSRHHLLKDVNDLNESNIVNNSPGRDGRRFSSSE